MVPAYMSDSICTPAGLSSRIPPNAYWYSDVGICGNTAGSPEQMLTSPFPKSTSDPADAGIEGRAPADKPIDAAVARIAEVVPP